ncbi:MAG: hypothetical protein ACK5KR_02925 [Breznakia sp.]
MRKGDRNMHSDLEKFFEKNETAFYINAKGEKKFRGVKGYYGDRIRNQEADEQAKIPPVPLSKVFSYVNDFIELIKSDHGYEKKCIRLDCIKLDGIQQIVLDNGIIAKACNWSRPDWNKKRRKYTYWDPKYDFIKDTFSLKSPRDIVWLKFTNTGHLGVVAKSFDINYNNENSSGTLLKQVKQEWDTSFVCIFPLTSDILGNLKSGDIEVAIGNYLISKGVPIIDYYSHNN